MSYLHQPMFTLIGCPRRSIWSLIATARGRGPGDAPGLTRTIVLFALTVGVLIGALACAAGMGSGAQHGAHGLRPSTPFTAETAAAAASPPPHRAHDTDGTETGDWTQSATTAASISGSDDGRSSADIGQNHPGMACVVPVDIQFPDFMVFGETEACSVSPIQTPFGSVGAPEPPVPRFS